MNGLADALDAEETARGKAVSAEAACRVAADACLRKCIGGRDSAVRALCGTVASLRTCVNAINTNVACVYPTIPKICSKLTMISACAARLDSRVEALEDGGDVEAKIAAESACRKAADAAERSCRKSADAALCSRVRALEDSTEIEMLRVSIGALDGEIDALDARVEALEQGGGGGGGDAKLAGDNVWTGTNRFVIPDAAPCVSKVLTIEDGASGCIGGGILFEQKRSLFPSLFIAACYSGGGAHDGRVMIPNPALRRARWEDADLSARANPSGVVPSAVVLSNPKSLMIELVTQSEFDAVPTQCKTCHSLYFILCGAEPL